jgi:hypothetical protein
MQSWSNPERLNKREVTGGSGTLDLGRPSR